MGIAVVDYTEMEMMSQKYESKAKEFIENVILRNLEENDKILISVTDSGTTCMPMQHLITEKRVEAGIMAQIFHIAQKYGISSKMILSNTHGDMLCEFW